MLFVYTIEMRTYVTFSLKEALQIASGLNGISYSLHSYTRNENATISTENFASHLASLCSISAEVH